MRWGMIWASVATVVAYSLWALGSHDCVASLTSQRDRGACAVSVWWTRAVQVVDAAIALLLLKELVGGTWSDGARRKVRSCELVWLGVVVARRCATARYTPCNPPPQKNPAPGWSSPMKNH